MTVHDEILVLANIIANAGNKPTVALIKTKLTKKVPLPTIISTLKNWQHQPDLISLPATEKQNIELKPSTNNTDQNLLKNELDEMKQEIIELKKLVSELMTQQKKL